MAEISLDKMEKERKPLEAFLRAHAVYKGRTIALGTPHPTEQGGEVEVARTNAPQGRARSDTIVPQRSDVSYLTSETD